MIYATLKFNSSNESTADRFIPRRRNFDLANYRLTIPPNVIYSTAKDVNEGPKYVNHAAQLYKQETYNNSLWSTLVGNTPEKILNFTDKQKPSTFSKDVLPVWPVNARKKPIIGAPVMVLDMPDLNFNLRLNATDWGSKGYLASVYCREVYLWHPEVCLSYKITRTNKSARKCVKWNPDGTSFAVALLREGFAVLGLDKDVQCSTIHFCGCGWSDCHITCFAWRKDGSLLVGCNTGTITYYPKDKSCVRTYSATDGGIMNIALSCDENYCSVLDWLGQIKIFSLRKLNKPISEFVEKWPNVYRVCAWHPWKDNLIAIAAKTGKIEIWNVSNLQQLAIGYPHNIVNIDAMTFNPVTGELVTSYFFIDEEYGETGINIIHVSSSISKTVDAVKWHSSRVQYLLWSPDGHQLATAGADENMCIWKFTDDSTKKSKRNSAKSSEPTSSLLDFNGFHTCIR